MIKEGDFEGFQVQEVLSRSSTTTVYRAFQHSLKRPVLIKELRPDLLREADILKRFQREAEVCALIKHENIVDIYDCSLQADRVFLVMEYVSGCALADLIQKHPQPSLELILAVMHQTLRGLAFAHSHQVIHRDIKPGNILLSKEGWVKITDFGLAICEGFDAVTQAGAVVGTPAYLAPEVISGGAVTSSSDLFSLGVTLYHLITGEKVFSAEHFSDSLRKVLSYHPPELTQYRPDLPPELSRIVGRMLEKQPAKRWAAADDVLAALDNQGLSQPIAESKAIIRSALLEPGVIRAGGTDRTPSSQAVKTRRRRPSVGIAAAAVLILMAVAGYFLFGRSPTSPPIPVGDTLSRQKPPEPDTIVQLPSVSRMDTVRIAEQETAALRKSLPPETEIRDSADSKKRPTALREIIAEPQPLEAGSRIRLEEIISTTDSNLAAAVLPGSIRVQCDPWAEVYLDDILVDKTPFAPLEVAAGRHRLGFYHPTFPPVVREVDVPSGQEILVSENLWHTVGRIMIIVTDTWADVIIDDRKVAITPLNEALIVPLGTHKVTLKNPAFNTWETTITCQRGAPPCTLRVNLRNHDGSIIAPASPGRAPDDSARLTGSLLPADRDTLAK